MLVYKNNNRGGFTLVELLATLAVLSVVITIVIYTTVSVIKNAKEKSYLFTMNNIVNNAYNYVLEKLDNAIWINKDNYQYQCVSVANLVESGYFKNDISRSTYKRRA